MINVRTCAVRQKVQRLKQYWWWWRRAVRDKCMRAEVNVPHLLAYIAYVRT